MLRKESIDQWIALSDQEKGKLLKLNDDYIKVMGRAPTLTFIGNYDASKVYNTGDVVIKDGGKFCVMYNNQFVEIADTQIIPDPSGPLLCTYDSMSKSKLGVPGDVVTNVLKACRDS